MKKWLLPLSVLSSSYVLMPDYRVIEKEHPTLFEGFYRQAKGAKIKNTSFKGSSLKYSDYDAGVSYTYTLNPEHFLTLGLGAAGQTIDWNKNPAFLGKNYDYVVGSVGLTSLGVENWRWSGAAILSFQTQNFGIKESGVIQALFWGEYFASSAFHFHAGFSAYTGVKNLYVLPIIGLDWKWTKAELSAVFPFDIALRYKPSKNIHLEVAGKWLGGPYRFPQRISKGIDGYKNGIFELFAPTTELGIYYHPSSHLNIGLTGGYTYGGWLFVKNEANHHGRYYNFESAPYGSINGMFKF